MAEKADGSYDPGGEGGGFGGGSTGDPIDPGQGKVVIDEDDPRHDDYTDRYNQQQSGGDHGPKDLDDNDPQKKTPVKTVAPPAPPVNKSAPLGSTTNPIKSRTGGL